MDASGNLYGTAEYGGASGDGVVFEYSPSGVIQVLASFNGTNGANPQAGLVMDASGNLYGTTTYGGASNDGTIFEYSATNGLTTLHSFSGTDGQNPAASLIFDANANLYGVTPGGGPSGSDGTLFMYSPTGTYTTSAVNFQTLASFSATSGGNSPAGGLLADGNGNLWGVTTYGNNNNGSIYEVPLYGVSGTITLPGCVNPAAIDPPQALWIEFWEPSGASEPYFTETVMLNSSGGYTVAAPNGSYTLHIKGLKWLAKNATGVVVNSQTVTGVNVTLLDGDLNNDNVIDLNDFSVMASAFGTSVGQAGWNPIADINCDGTVNMTDFNLFSPNFGLMGDPVP